MMRWCAALARAGAAVVCVVCAGAGLGSIGCSSSGGSADAGSHDASHDGLPPLGIAESDCTTDTCWAPATCSGFLLGPKQPVAYCTLVCDPDAGGCPSGTTCAVELGIGRCLKTCGSNSDCQGGFACFDGGFCFSPYTGADTVGD